ncbi:MAG: MMPL family transporter [Pseudorhodoplanes sp.]|nr:MMPL family transporter [Pseudorhodoplanes sp.]
MLKSTVVAIVTFSTRFAWAVVLAAVLLTAASVYYAATHFAITTDVSKLISSKPMWRQREDAFEEAFPHRRDLILAVINAPTPEASKQAANLLTKKLSEQPKLFKSVHQPGSGSFFEQNALLFLPTEEVGRTLGQLTRLRPLLQIVASDPTLRGAATLLNTSLIGIRAGQAKLDDYTRPLTMMSDALENVLAGKPTTFSWRVLLSGKAEPRELRRFIEVEPVLDYSALEPGGVPAQAIRDAATQLNLASEFGATVRLTGPVAISNEEFATLKENALLNHTLTIIAVLVILWLALGSPRIIFAVFASMLVGLAITAAIGLMMVGALNLISVAFAVLFVGLGVDFGIQFSVRYREERHKKDDLMVALQRAAARAGMPLTLAATATAAGFLSFLPTEYRGLSELGLIAGVGMIIALITSITLLPALLRLLNPPGEPAELGYRALAPVDRFMEKHRIPIVLMTGIVAFAGLPLLLKLEFDFNPLNLRSPKVESVATYLELRRDPDTNTNSIEVLADSPAEAAEVATKLARLPDVSRTMTLQNFVPEGQTEKLAQIRAAARTLDPVLNPARPAAPPSDADVVAALRTVADSLQKAAGNNEGPGADAARRASDLLGKLAQAEPAVRERATQVFIPPLKTSLDDLRNMLKAQPVTLQSLPREITRDWTTPDGKARVQVSAKGDPTNNDVLRQFARAVSAVEPRATGAPVSIQESGHLIVSAFLWAGFWSLLSIAILLWIVLRRITDVLLTLVPLLLAGVLTLEICVLIGLPLNFANIIALPLLLGVGVAFKIYYIMAWRAGQTNLLQTSLTRAVVYSALATATAFGSLWFSSHPGTSSMGKLLALSLATTMLAAVLFQPALMGPPREQKKPSGKKKKPSAQPSETAEKASEHAAA